MKILVLSDSHSSLRLMRRAVETIRPNAVVHLGDYYDDGAAIAEENPELPFHQVAGNCDRFRCPPGVRGMLCYNVCGVKLYMTHGHNHHVKSTLFRLLSDARRENAAAALYGHTHNADCHWEDGLLVMNPGTCGMGHRTAGLIEVTDSQITNCRIIDELDLEG